MLLDKPALKLRVNTENALSILGTVLKERHWKNFNVASLNLVYVPYYFFNFDVYEETEGKAQTYSSEMCLNAVTGKLEPMLIQILSEIPTEQTKEITEKQYKIEKPTTKEKEVKEIAQIKVAGEMRIPKTGVTVSGVHLVYVPMWVIWADLGRRTKRIDLDAISGSPLNIQDVPLRERGFLEVTADTLSELTTPKGWVDYSKKAFNWSAHVAGSAVSGAGKQAAAGPGIANWLLFTTMGRYALIGAAIILLLLYIVYMK